MSVAVDLTDVIQVVKSEKDGYTEYHAVLGEVSGHALWSAWEQKKRDEGDHPQLTL